MKIHQAYVLEGVGGDFWRDREAIQSGAVEDGFAYEGKPITPGFTTIVQSSEAVCIMLVLEDGQTACGDGTSVAYSALSGRDPLLFAKNYIPIVEKEVIPKLIGKDLHSFRSLAAELDHLLVQGKRLHSGIRYGLTQAILDGVAKANRTTMAEVVAREYGTKMVQEPIPLFAQCSSSDWYTMVDKIILRRIPIFPHAAVNTLSKLDKFQAYVEWTRKRIQNLTEASYHPVLHYDLYGNVGRRFGRNFSKMITYLKSLSETASPYPLRLEDPLIMSNRDSQIEQMQRLRRALKEEGLKIEIVADEWCNEFQDVQAFADASAADLIQLKPPDLGGIHHLVESILYCQQKGTMTYLGGSCCETEMSARACLHVALATGVDEFLIKPGVGVGTGYVIAHNEMQRVLALIKGKPGRA